MNSPTVGAWGFLVGVFGTVITCLGFIFTLRQLTEAKTASEAAAAAVLGLKFRVAHYEVAHELARAIQGLTETQRHLRNDNWTDFVSSYGEVRIAAVRLAEINSVLSPEDREALSRLAETCASTLRRVYVSQQKGSSPPDVAKAMHAVGLQLVSVTKIQLRLGASL